MKAFSGTISEVKIEDYGPASYFRCDGQILGNRIADRQNRSMFPEAYVHCRMESFKWEIYGEDISLQKELVERFIGQFFEFQKECNGLYIQSTTRGSGKTMLACCIGNEIIRQHDVSVKFTTMSEYIECVRGSGRSESEKEKAKSIREATLLIVDDIGATTEDRGWIEDVIFRLVNYRYERHLSTIYTSNVPINELKCGDRSMERINATSFEVIIPEVNIRREKADQYKRDFYNRIRQKGNTTSLSEKANV